MGIPVSCPNGHHFKVKDKYAGKKGLCPKCVGKEVPVQVPDLTSSTDAQAQQQQRESIATRGKAIAPSPADYAASVLDDSLHDDASSSGSLLGSSVIRHHVRCACGQSVPMWFAKCPGCGKFMEQR